MTAFRWWSLTGVIQVLKLLSSMSGHWGRCSQYNRYTALWSKNPKHNQKHSKSFEENSDVTRLRWMTSSRLSAAVCTRSSLRSFVLFCKVFLGRRTCFLQLHAGAALFLQRQKNEKMKKTKNKRKTNNYNTLAKMLKIYKIIHRSLSIQNIYSMIL